MTIVSNTTVMICNRGTATEASLIEAKYEYGSDYVYYLGVPELPVPETQVVDITDQIEEVKQPQGGTKEEIIEGVKDIGRQGLKHQLDNVPLSPSDLVCIYYVDEHMSWFEEGVDLAERILNGELSDLVLWGEKKMQYLFYRTLEYMNFNQVTFEKQKLSDSLIGDISKGLGDVVKGFLQYCEDKTTLSGIEREVVDRDVFKELLNKYASGSLSDEQTMKELESLFKGTTQEGLASELFNKMKSFDSICFFVNKFKTIETVSKISDKVMDCMNQYLLLNGIDRNSMMSVAKVYLSSDDLIIRRVGEKLRQFANANRVEQLTMIATDTFADYGLDMLAKALSEKAVSSNLTIDIAQFTANVFTDVDKLAGLKDKMKWSVDAVKASYIQFEEAEEAYRKSGSDEDLLEAGRVLNIYYGTAYQAEESLFDLFNTIRDSNFGDCFIDAKHEEMMKQIKQIVASLKLSTKINTMYANALQDGDLQSFQSAMQEIKTLREKLNQGVEEALQ